MDENGTSCIRISDGRENPRVSKRQKDYSLAPIAVISHAFLAWIKRKAGTGIPRSPSDLLLEVSNGITGTPLYNGNISETHWKTGSDNFLRKYSYEYDDLNRLTDAVYQKPDMTNPVTNAYDESIQYDKNGNIIGLQRNGYLDATDGQTYAIDGLTYTYASGTNRLVTVTDATNSLDGFTDGVNPQGGTDYSYDSNGNMTQDWNKKIVDIAYNHLNLPVKVTFSLTGENRIDYIYNALGTKVQKTVVSTNVQTGTTAVVTDYLGGFQYKDERMEFFPTAEGYVSVTDGVSFNYVYNYTDHLGNIRLSYTRDNGIVKVLEENHYYPFGMRHSNYGDDRHDYVRNPDGSGYAVVEPVVRNKYQYKYNGKEYQDELGLNFYDFGARNYDPAIGRWMNIDPLAEQMRRWSPYNYCFNNPMRFTDPDGMGPDDWIVHTQSDGTQAITYDVGVQTVEQAKAQGYKNVETVFASGSGYDTGTGEQLNFQANGTYSIDGNAMSVADGAHTTQGGTVIAENSIGRVNMFAGGLANTTLGVVGTIGSATSIPLSGGLSSAAAAVAITLSIGEISIGLSQMADSFSSAPNQTLHDYSTVPGLVAGQNGSQYAPLIDGVSGWSPGSLTGGNVIGTIDAVNGVSKGENVLFNSASVIDASLDAKGLYDGITKPK